jgi:HTH-type transcriptional regulator/antitoxin HigA
MIQTEKEYNAIIKRIEVLLQNPNTVENHEAPEYVELNILSDFVADFEERYYDKKTDAYRNYEITNV